MKSLHLGKIACLCAVWAGEVPIWYQRSIFHRCHCIENSLGSLLGAAVGLNECKMTAEMQNISWHRQKNFLWTSHIRPHENVSVVILFLAIFRSLEMSWKHVNNKASWWVWVSKTCCTYRSRKIFYMYFGREMLSTAARHDSSDVSSWT